MKTLLTFVMLAAVAAVTAQAPPPLYIQIVSHNEPTDNLQQSINYQLMKTKTMQLAAIVDSKNARWNLQTSDGFVFGARQDEINTGNNIFRMLAAAPYNDNIEIDPRNKNFPGRNIADQWYLLDSLGANPSYTVGGFLWYICQPSSMQPDWWQYQDSITGLVYGNKMKFEKLSGAGSAGFTLHCNDLYDFGIFKPDTVTNFYSHNPARSLWCMGTGCAPLLDSLNDEQAVIDLIQAQVDSIQNGLWPANKFYVTRIMTNQREYGPLFMQKISKVIDSLNVIPTTKLQWATIGETFTAFQAWQQNTGLDYSMWSCGETLNSMNQPAANGTSLKLFPNPVRSGSALTIQPGDAAAHVVKLYDNTGRLLLQETISSESVLHLPALASGLYFLRMDDARVERVVVE